ncbi:MAG: citryl-CoA lyase [Vicinamibacterales bacterium]
MPHSTDSETPSTERRSRPRSPRSDEWRTAITEIAPNRIAVRGYLVDEMMGRLSFSDAIYLILRGELPTPSVGRLFSAVLVSSIDHGVTPPSTLAARNVATTGAPLRASVASGVLGFGMYHGGDIESCMRFLDKALARVREGVRPADAAAELVNECLRMDRPCPGFGHRIHTADPRAARLFQMAHELELEGEHVRMIREIVRVLEARPDRDSHPLPVNVDGAIAAVCADLGFEPDVANALFIISRVPGLVAHSHEERAREKPMRQIDPKDHVYDGPPRRRLPESGK